MDETIHSLLEKVPNDSLEKKKKILGSLVDELPEDQLNELIENLSDAYFKNRLSKYTEPRPLPPRNSPEFHFLLLAEEYNGNVVRKVFTQNGISPFIFNKCVKKYNLLEISPGFYVFSSIPPDGPFLLQQQYASAVISHESALYYLGLSDVTPKKIIMSMPKNYNFSQIMQAQNVNSPYRKISEVTTPQNSSALSVDYLDNDPIILIRNNDIADEEKMSVKSFYGNPIYVTTPERSIVDALKPRFHVEEEIITSAIARYFNSSAVNQTKLRRIAKQQNVPAELDHYLWQLGFH